MDTNRYFNVFYVLLIGIFSIAQIHITQGQCSPNAIEIPNNGVDEDCDNLDDIFLHMPAHIYMVEGKNFELYFRNTILSTHAADYTFEVQTSLPGVIANGKWSYTPSFSDVGEHAFTLRVLSPNGQFLGSATSSVRISAANSPANLPEQRFVMMGHSFINQGYMPYYYRLLSDEPGNPTVALLGNQFNWVDGVSSHEAIGGASWKFFLNDPSSPFYVAGQLNLNSYFDNLIGFGQRPELILIHLDVADYCFPGTLTASTIEEVENYVDADYTDHVLPFMNALRAAAPNSKIGICYASPPNSRPQSLVNFFGATSILSDWYRWKKIVNTLYFKYDEYFRGRESENIYMLPIHLDIDDVNEFDINDPVHPWKMGQPLTEGSGYKEIAKSVFAWTKYIFAQSASGVCAVNTSTSNVTCNNNGTPIDPSDDTFGFDLAVSGVNGGTSWQGNANGQSISGAFGGSTPINGFPISNGPASFSIADTQNPGCQSSVLVAAPATCSDGVGSTIDLELSMASLPAAPVNYTNFTVTLIVQNTAQKTAQGVKIFVPKPGNDVNYQGADAFNASQGTFRWYSDFIWDVGNLPPLGSATLSINYFLLTTNPLTFYAEVTEASPIDSDSTPGNGNGVSANEDDETAVSINGGAPPTPCSLSGNVSNVSCNDNGTDTNPSDDTYSFSLLVNGTNAGTGWTTTIAGNTYNGSYGQATSLGPLPISSGDLSFTIRDAQDANCSITRTAAAPSTCSNNTGGGTDTDLSLSVTGSAASVPAFDFFTATWTLRNTSTVAATNISVRLNVPSGAVEQGGNEGNASRGTYKWWNRAWEITNLDPGQSATLRANYFTLSEASMTFYGEVETASPIDDDSTPGNGNNNTPIEDDEAAVSLNGAGPIVCSISGSTSNVICSDAGTPTDASDDTFTFDLLVNGNNASSAWDANISGQILTGLYGVPKKCGPFLISNGNVSFSIQDDLDTNCSTSASASAPSTCSAPPTTGPCESVSAHPWHEWISRVQIGQFIQNSAKSYYTDYSNGTAVTLQKGSANSLLFTTTYSFFTYDEYYKVWIDYNHDGAFSDVNEVAFSGTLSAPPAGSNTSKNMSGLINIPASALTGATKMRISLKRNSFAGPCETIDFGEVEDYAVVINSNAIVDQQGIDADYIWLNAKANFGAVDLTWTAQTGLSDFEILSGTSAFDLEKIGDKKNGSTTDILQYNFSNTVTETGRYFYQIQAYNAAGDLIKSAIQSIDVQLLEDLVSMFPNPTSSITNLVFSEKINAPISIQVYNTYGKIIKQRDIEQQGMLSLYTQNYGVGVYLVRIQIEGQRPIVHRLVVQN